MARIVIGEGFWATIYGYLNSMFTELYAWATTNNAKVTNATHSGDATGDTVLTLSNTGVAAGAYNSANITVDAKGRLLAASSGSVVPKYSGTVDLPNDATTTKVTTVTTEPYSIMLRYTNPLTLRDEDTGLKCDHAIVGGFLVLYIYNGDTVPLNGVKIKILY